MIKVDEIIQCGDEFLIRSDGELIKDWDCIDISRAKFRLETGTRRKRHLGKIITRKLLDCQEWTCMICYADLRQTEFEIDHIIPLSIGGSNNISNLMVLCRRCNRHKGSQVFRSFDLLKYSILKRIQSG